MEDSIRFNTDPQLLTLDYKDQIKHLKEKIYSKSSSKYFDGISLTSRMMLHFVICVIETFNKKSLFNYYDMFNTVVEQECEITYQNAVAAYNEQLRQSFANKTEPFETQELFDLLQSARDLAVDNFAIAGEIRAKCKIYDEKVQALQAVFTDKEEKLIAINESLAQKSAYKLQ